jgi:hypothetical protein
VNIIDVLDGVFDRDVGWRPVSGSIKPVHIANGLFRTLLRRRYDIKRTVAFLRPSSEGERTFEFMVQKSSDPRFAAFADSSKRARFEQLRDYARGLLAADGAVFPSAENSSLTLTCREMISRDPNDRKVGAFAAALLDGRDGKGALGRLIRKWLPENEQTPSDPITALAWPLLSHEPDLLASETAQLAENSIANATIDLLEQAATRLAEHDESNQNRLGSLERAVHFSVLGLLAHAQGLAAHGSLDKRVPLIMTASAEKGSALTIASEESLTRMFDQFDEFLVSRLSSRLRKKQAIKYGTKRSDDKRLVIPAQRLDAVRKFFRSINGYRDTAVTEELLDERMNRWSRARRTRGKDDPNLVMADALVTSYLEENKGGNPREFLQAIGCRTGLIYPHFEGRSSEKRVRPSVEILEVLVKACTPVDRPVSDLQFLDEVWRTFGFVTGGRPDDALLLQDAGIEVAFEELSSNWDRLVSRLADIGLARRYPDNISYIGRFNG